MTYKTPRHNIHMSSHHAAQALLFRDDNGLHHVDELADAMAERLMVDVELRHQCSLQRLRSSRLAVIERAIQTYADQNCRPLSHYPSIAKDLAAHLLPSLERGWDIKKSENL